MSINKDTHTVMSVTVTRETTKIFEKLCKKERRSKSNMISILIDKYIEENNSEEVK